jgi:D-alanyl-D-alanine carboxypeptidase
MGRIDEAIDRALAYAEARMRADATPGMALVVTDRSRTLRIACLGLANIDAGVPVGPRHLFQIGSIGKAFTAVVAMQLEDEGLLDLGSAIETYLPWFEVGSRSEPITIHHLLSHTSGLVSGSLGFGDPYAEVWSLRDTDVEWAPGERYHYSNAGYKAVGLAIEAVCERPFPEVLRKRVLAPLEMNGTAPALIAEVRPRQATPYVPLFDDRPWRPGHELAPAAWFEDDGADGSISSTPEDMARFLRFLLARGAGTDGRRILSDAGYIRMTTPSQPAGEKPYGYGLGLEEAGRGVRFVHSGDMVGFRAHLLADPDGGIGVVAMANGPARPGLVTRYAADALIAALADETLPSPPAIEDDLSVGDASVYAGTWAGDDGRLVIDASGDRLFLDHGTERIPLHAVDGQSTPAFFAEHPAFARAFLEYEHLPGGMLRLWHGRRAYERTGARDPSSTRAPASPFEGLFRSYSPWQPSVRFVHRGDRLWMADPLGEPGVPLERVGGDTFRIAEASPTPTRIRFSRVIGGRARVATIEGCDLYRSYDPPSVWNEGVLSA